MDPHPKFGLNVKTHVTTHTLREYEKVYDSHDEVFWGEQYTFPSWSKIA